MSQSTTSYVAAEVRAELGRQGHDKAWLARELGENEMWVGRRLRGVINFSADDVVRIARALDVSPAQFLPDTVTASAA